MRHTAGSVSISDTADSRLGFLFSILSGFSFGLMSFLVNLSSKTPSAELVFLRGLFCCFVLLPFVGRQLKLLLTKQATSLWIRSAAGATAMLCLFWNLQHTKVGTATALSNLAPVLVTLLSWRLFGEKITVREAAAIMLTVFGALTLYRSGISSTIAAVGFFGALCVSVAQLALRRAALKFSPSLVVWCMSLMTVFAAPLAPTTSWLVPKQDLAVVFGVGLTGLLGQVFMTFAYMHLRASLASAFGLSTLIWGVLFQSIFTQSIPNLRELISYGLILAGVCTLQLVSETKKEDTDLSFQ